MINNKKIFSQNLHDKKVKVRSAGKNFVLVHQYDRRDVSCKPAISYIYVMSLAFQRPIINRKNCMVESPYASSANFWLNAVLVVNISSCPLTFNPTMERDDKYVCIQLKIRMSTKSAQKTISNEKIS